MLDILDFDIPTVLLEKKVSTGKGVSENVYILIC